MWKSKIKCMLSERIEEKGSAKTVESKKIIIK